MDNLRDRLSGLEVIMEQKHEIMGTQHIDPAHLDRCHSENSRLKEDLASQADRINSKDDTILKLKQQLGQAVKQDGLRARCRQLERENGELRIRLKELAEAQKQTKQINGRLEKTAQ